MKNFAYLVNRGKVCDIYSGDYLLMDRTNRFSVDDANLPGEIPYKGLILNQISKKWMEMTSHIVKNHLLATDAKTLLSFGAKPDQMGRIVAVNPCFRIPFEIILRRYYIEKSSSWNTYKENGTICGIPVRKGMKNCEELDEVLFTPSTKAENGEHDVNISFEEMKLRMRDFIYNLFNEVYPEKEDGNDGVDSEETGVQEEFEDEITFEEYCNEFADRLCDQIRDVSMKLYEFAYNYAYDRGIIIADTKIEFGLNSDMELVVIDELFTPDSSRFWSLKYYKPGVDQKSMDKQYLRDYVHKQLNWHGLQDGPAPKVPDYVKINVSQIYCDIYYQLFDESVVHLTEELAYEWHNAQKELGIEDD